MSPQGIKPILLCNAAFSGLSGITLVTAAGWFSQVFGGTNSFWFIGIGAGLILFAGDILWHITRPNLTRPKAWYFTVSDAFWVLASMGLLATGTISSIEAQVLVWAAAAAVLIFTVLQLWHLMQNSMAQTLHPVSK